MGWLIALGVLILLAILPLGVSVKYNAAGLLLKLVIGPARLQLLPKAKKDPPKEKKQQPKEKKIEKKAAPKEPAEEKGGSLTDFLPLVQVALDFLNGFRRKLRVKRLELKLIMAADDPCDLAVNYGRAWAAVGSLWPLLERCFIIKKRDVQVECDFTAQQTLIILRADICITLGRLLCLTIYHGIQALKAYLSIQKSRKGGTKV